MRCHATFNGFRCDQDMSEHNPEEHSFWIRWGDDGTPLVDMPLTPLEVTQEAARTPLTMLPEVPQEAAEGAKERAWHLSDIGGIRYDEQTAERCGICGHSWHQGPCPLKIQAGDYQVDCGCETAAI